MDVAYAMGQGGAGGDGAGGLAGFIPLLLMGCIFGLVLGSIAKRKGKSQGLWFFAGFVPGWNLFGSIWLASLPDKSIFDEIVSLKDELKKINSIYNGNHESTATGESKTWRCNCGMVNDVNILNCPECGLKKDYLFKQADKA